MEEERWMKPKVKEKKLKNSFFQFSHWDPEWTKDYMCKFRYLKRDLRWNRHRVLTTTHKIKVEFYKWLREKIRYLINLWTSN